MFMMPASRARPHPQKAGRGAPQLMNGAFTVQPWMNGQTIYLTGDTFYTVTFGRPWNYPAGFEVTLVNASASRGKGITAFSAFNPLNSNIIWPGAANRVYNTSNSGTNGWFRERYRYKPLVAQSTMFFDAVNGSDSNDGLAAGAGNARLTLQTAISIVGNEWDLTFNNAPCLLFQLADGTYTGGIHLAAPIMGGAGNAAFKINGNNSTPSNVVIQGGIATFDNTVLELSNFALDDSATSFCLSLNTNAKVRCEGGLIFGNTSAGGTQISVAQGGQFIVDSGFSVSAAPATGNGTFLNVTDPGSLANIVGQTITFSASVTYNTTMVAQNGGMVECAGATFSLGGNTVTGTRFSVSNLGAILTGGGGANFIPGSVAGVGTNPGASPWGLYT